MERFLNTRLLEIMMDMLSFQIETVTCEQLQLLLEKVMKRELEDYHDFLNQKMLEIKEQIMKPSQIFKHLYLV